MLLPKVQSIMMDGCGSIGFIKTIRISVSFMRRTMSRLEAGRTFITAFGLSEWVSYEVEGMPGGQD